MIGRLLLDSKSIFEDHLKDMQTIIRNSTQSSLDLSLLTDGLKEERDKGITIDVAYRYFTTPKRKFIIADCPGHFEYTRNMVTGASSSNAALILVDARNGLEEQTKRHFFITSLLGIPNIVFCVNKMDLVDYDETVFLTLCNQIKEYCSKFMKNTVRFIPLSALFGENVVDRSTLMNWYHGPSLLSVLETMGISGDENMEARFQVQFVSRFFDNEGVSYIGCYGRVVSGHFRKGEKIQVMPSGLITTIKKIIVFKKNVKEAFAPMSVILALDKSINVRRGDMIVNMNDRPLFANELTLMLCWLDDCNFDFNQEYILRHSSDEQLAKVTKIFYKINVNNLEKIEREKNLKINEIAKVQIKLKNIISYDLYIKNRTTGSLILIDKISKNTIAAGMIC